MRVTDSASIEAGVEAEVRPVPEDEPVVEVFEAVVEVVEAVVRAAAWAGPATVSVAAHAASRKAKRDRALSFHVAGRVS
ncbi:hypothetical protein AB0L05_18730 [Nonomuraea pusilla]|uniref:hypothetical protein n=1 Tax=Nonomuraea pusilla TaxID=46177 RepID=UPI00332A10CE